MVLSAVAVIAVTVAAFVRVRWHLKSRHPQPEAPADDGGNHTEDNVENRRT